MRAGIRRALLAVPGVGVGVRRARLLGAFPLLAGVLTLVITPLVTFAAAAVGFACYVLSRLVLDAAVLREENDMTI